MLSISEGDIWSSCTDLVAITNVRYQGGPIDMGARTYSFGNSPRANEHNSDVLPHAPTGGGVGTEDTRRWLRGMVRTIAYNDELPSNL